MPSRPFSSSNAWTTWYIFFDHNSIKLPYRLDISTMQRGLDNFNLARGHEPKVAIPIHEEIPHIHMDEKPHIGERSTDASSIGAAETDDYPDKPTDEELHTLRRVSGTIPWAAYSIAFVELCERFGYYGTTIVCE